MFILLLPQVWGQVHYELNKIICQSKQVEIDKQVLIGKGLYDHLPLTLPLGH